MKILFDARWILLEDRFDGVSRYSYELARVLAEQPGLEVAWLIHDIRQLTKLPEGDYVLANDPNNLLKEVFSLAKTINASGYNIVYSPFFMMGTMGKHYKLVLTIHDLIYFKHRTPPHWLPWYVRIGWRLFHLTYTPMRWQLNRADAVATVSETAKQELITAQATKRPITTVSNAVSQEFSTSEPVDHHLSKSIVYMGAFTPYKNVECLIDSLQYLPDITLHLCSKAPAKRRAQLQKRADTLKVGTQLVWHNGVTDEQYQSLLSSARCSISASKIEGFGLPVLEAQKRGVPVVCSDTPIFHEVGGDGALYFDITNPKAAAEAINTLADKSASSKLITSGYTNTRRYIWQNSAIQAFEGIIKKLPQ